MENEGKRSSAVGLVLISISCSMLLLLARVIYTKLVFPRYLGKGPD